MNSQVPSGWRRTTSVLWPSTMRDRLQPDGRRQGLAGARTADQHDVMGFIDEVALVQRTNPGLVDRALTEVESDEVTVGREPCRSRSSVACAILNNSSASSAAVVASVCMPHRLQRFEGRRQLGERRAATRGTGLALHHGEVMPPVVDRLESSAMAGAPRTI